MGKSQACCPHCGDSTKDIAHAPWTCTFARLCWCLTNILWRVISTWNGSTKDWMLSASKELGNYEFGLFLTICWMLWWTTSRKAAEDVQIPAEQVVGAAKNYLDEFLLHTEKITSRQTASSPSRWTPPDTDFIKINYDGALFEDTLEIGFGIIARDSNGQCVGWLAHRLSMTATSKITEALAAREAIQFGIQRGWTRIILEGDYATLFHKLKSRDPDLSHTGPITSDIKYCSLQLHFFSLSLVRRTANKVAHAIARGAVESL
ncbi:UNVERIFIED_CONTAM: hypothetical protein Slati_1325100 [Sesamum latifolium]|uniref:RNase H type-1 domain-containing protein n=1 Tax=Sesamum latifolium TaxID=2727402 RepID=A0AAW2XIG6_9LAMI